MFNQTNDSEKYKIWRSVLSALVAVVVIAITTQAQQPFQDAKGEGTIFINGDGFAQVNVADPSIRIGYLRNLSTSNWIFGFNLSGKLSGTRAALIGNNNLAPDAKGSFSIGYKWLPSTEGCGNNKDNKTSMSLASVINPDSKCVFKKIIVSRRFRAELQKRLWEEGVLDRDKTLPEPIRAENLFDYLGELETSVLRGKNLGGALFDMPDVKKFFPKFQQLVFQGGYGFKQYSLYNPLAAFDDQVYKKSFHSPSAQLIYTRQINGRTLFGAGAGVQRSNNSGGLTEIEVRDFTTTTGGTTTREVARVRKALRGDFKEFTEAFVNTDFVFFPKQLDNRIGINFFTRSGLTGSEKSIRPGIGIFLSEKGAPTKVVGGISFSVDNNGKANVTLIAGYNF